VASLLAVLALTCVPVFGSASNGTAQPAEGCVERTAEATPPPRLPPRPTRVKRNRGQAKEVGALESCPEGQVPVIVPAERNVPKGNPLIGNVKGSAEEFFGSPEAERKIRKAQRRFRRVYPKNGGNPPPDIARPAQATCAGIAYFSSCYYYGSSAFARPARGGGMTMQVHHPAYDGSGGAGHTLDEISVQGGAAGGNIVELGWNISTSQYSNANPHLFVFHWIGWNPTCYDVCGWQQYSPTYAPGMDINALVGSEVYVGWVYYQGNWWAWFNNQWLGYFPGSRWSGNYTSNAMSQWFGEVSTANGVPPHTDMGSGTFPLSTQAARNATLCDVDPSVWVCFYRDQQATSATAISYYRSIRSGFGQVRYGGPGE
jgi:neprosin-like protein